MRSKIWKLICIFAQQGEVMFFMFHTIKIAILVLFFMKIYLISSTLVSDSMRIDYSVIAETYYYPCGCDTTSHQDTLYLDFKKEKFDKSNSCDIKSEYDSSQSTKFIKVFIKNKNVVISNNGSRFNLQP